MDYSFSPGDIVLLKEVSYTDHPKYHLVLSVEEDLFFTINTEINPTVRLNPTLLESQVLYKVDQGKSFPEHDCYIACHQIPEVFSAEVEDGLKSGRTEIKGKIDLKTLKAVLNVLYSHAKTLTGRERRIAIENLEALYKELNNR